MGVEGPREVRPRVFYLRDKDGNLVIVPDMTYEDWRRLDDLARGLQDDQPTYSLGSAKISGEVQGGKARLSVELSVTILASNQAWQRIPLRFHTAALSATPRHEGEGEFFVDYDPEGEGYVAWLRAAENSKHKIFLPLLAEVQEVGPETRLSIAAPRATSGSIVLKVPQAQATAVVLQRATERALNDVFADGAGTRLEMLGAVGDFQLAWRAGASAVPQTRQTLDVRGSMLVKLEGRRRITCEARLRVRSFGAPLESFTVQLPPGMRLVTLEQAGLRFNVLEPTIDEASQKQIQVIEVRLEAKANGPVEVPLVAEYVREGGAAEEQPIEVAGFEVLDAVKQWGTIDLVVEGDLSAAWLEGANVRRSDEVLTPDARGVKSLARFEYDAQPFSLQVQVVPRRTRVTVEPLYVVYVEDQQLRLDATLKYKVRGARTYNVEYDFSGWTIDRVGPDAIVQSEALLTERVSPLAIPLAATALPSSGDFEIKIQAHRDLVPGAPEVRFDIPRPIGGSLTPGNVVIVPANNIELTTRSADLQGLLSDPLPTTLKLPPRQQPPQFYRELGGNTVARFLGTIEVRRRMVSVATTGQVQIDLGRASVTQRLTYNIAYEPLRNVELEVPRNLWETGQVQITLDDEALPVMLLPEEDQIAQTQRARVRVDLMADRIGRLELVVRYVLPLPGLRPDGGEVATSEGARPAGQEPPFALPLALPRLDGEVLKTNTSLLFTHAEQLEVLPLDESWSVSQPYAPTDDRPREATWSHPTGAAVLPLGVKFRQTGNGGSVAIDQAWVQSWLAPEQRQDRAIFRVTTAAPRLRIKLPADVRENGLVAAINGRRVTRYLLDPDGVLTLEMPSGMAATTHVIELWYEFAQGRPAIGPMRLTAPTVQGASEARRAYWQVLLPENEHLVFGSPRLASDLRWQWTGTHFGRTGRLSQGDLEQWIGASRQADLPRATNHYLFSGFGALEELELRTAARRSVLLACSGLVLVLGLALLYLPVARHPLVLAAGGVTLGMLALWTPDLAMMSAQGAVVGLLCVLLARLLRSLFGRREFPSVATRQPSLSAIEAKSTEPHLRYDPGSQATTATAPAMAAAPAESQS